MGQYGCYAEVLIPVDNTGMMGTIRRSPRKLRAALTTSNTIIIKCLADTDKECGLVIFMNKSIELSIGNLLVRLSDIADSKDL